MPPDPRKPRSNQSSARRRPPADAPRLRPDPAMPRHQRRLVRAIGKRADLILFPDEEVVALTEAVEDAPRATRIVLGAAWAPCQRVALLFTGRRLIEIGIGGAGLRARGRVRSFPWDGIPSFQIIDDRLEIRTWDGEVHTWYLRDVPDPGIEGRLNRRVNLAVSTFVPSQSRTAPLRHCTKCGSERPSTKESCRMCGARIRTSRRASQLAMVTPGGGHFYAGRLVGGTVRLLLETSIFVLLALQVLGTTDPWRVAVVVAAGCGLLGLAKLHGAWSARLLARRAGAISVKAGEVWRWLVPIGLVASIAVLVSPLFAVGVLERDVSWDMMFIDSEKGWHRVTPKADDSMEAAATVRAVWSDAEDHRVVLQAWPFPPLRSTASVQADLVREFDAEDSPRRVGNLVVIPARISGVKGATLVTDLVVDSTGRDVHSLSTVAAPGHEDEARNLLAWLLDRAVLVKADNPG